MKTNERIGQPTGIADLLGPYAEAASLRITGKSLEEHAAKWQHRRREGRAKGCFRGGVMLEQQSDAQAFNSNDLHSEVARFSAYYGLCEDDDLSLTRGVPIWAVVENRKRHGLNFPTIPKTSDGKDTETLIVFILNPDKYPS